MGLREAGSSGAAERQSLSWAGTAGVATAAMAAALLALYAVSALGPALAHDLQLPRSAVGALVTATFSVACVASLVAGRVVDISGPLARRPTGLTGAMGLMMTFAIAGALLVLSVSGVKATGAFALLWGSILATRTVDVVVHCARGSTPTGSCWCCWS